MTSEGITGDWSYNTNNELTGYDDVSYVYDDNGNMTQKTVAGVVTKFFYNLADRLTEVRDGSDALIASYYYDPFGRRLWKDVGGVRTYFHYADEGLIGEYDSTGNEIKTYGYKPGSIWTTDPLFMKVGTEYYFFHTDHLGTPQKLTSANGAVAWAATYSSFGEAMVDAASTITNPLRFPGQYYDAETGLHYNWHRFFDPSTGRYLRVDPIGFLGGINLFAYCLNNPINQRDAFGFGILPQIFDAKKAAEKTKMSWKLHERLKQIEGLMAEALRKKLTGELSGCDFAKVKAVLEAEYRKTYNRIRLLAASQAMDYYIDIYVPPHIGKKNEKKKICFY